MFPIRWHGRFGGFDHQRFQALRGGGIALVIELIELECLHQIGDIGTRCGDAGFIGAPHDIGHNNRRKGGDDDQYDHQFNQGKAAGGKAGKFVGSFIHKVNFSVQVLQADTECRHVDNSDSTSAIIDFDIF